MRKRRASGGDLGWFSPTELPDEFKTPIEGKSKGEYSDPFRTGLWRAYLESDRPRLLAQDHAQRRLQPYRADDARQKAKASSSVGSKRSPTKPTSNASSKIRRNAQSKSRVTRLGFSILLRLAPPANSGPKVSASNRRNGAGRSGGRRLRQRSRR
ncbi:MAG: peptidylprolyl isomerase [bacterium]|nr:peptidylprolyl isomerase [bacterium]